MWHWCVALVSGTVVWYESSVLSVLLIFPSEQRTVDFNYLLMVVKQLFDEETNGYLEKQQDQSTLRAIISVSNVSDSSFLVLTGSENRL